MMKKTGTSVRARKRFGYLMVAPAFLTLFIMTIYPFIYMIVVSFHRWAIRRERLQFRAAALWAVIGALVGVLLRTLTASLYIYSTVVRWFSDFPRMMQLIFLPIFAFSFLAILYFFASFYREQRQTS